MRTGHEAGGDGGRRGLELAMLQERLLETHDPLETFFAAWRFGPGTMWRHALP